MGRGLLLLLALTACQREPSFDERYADAEARIRDTSASIDAQLANEQAGVEPADTAPANTVP